MKKLQIAGLIALFLEVLLWMAGRTLFTLPDWAVRLNGILMLITLPLLVFVTVRVLKKV